MRKLPHQLKYLKAVERSKDAFPSSTSLLPVSSPFPFRRRRTKKIEMKTKEPRAIGKEGERATRNPPIIVESPAPKDHEKLKLFVAFAKPPASSPSVIQSSIFGQRKLIATP